jgi:acetylornithine/succinyldiaminopimelate/putrescine aminotransferase
MTSQEISRRLRNRKVLANGVGPDAIRFVTHLDVDRDQCAFALDAMGSVCGALAQRT